MLPRCAKAIARPISWRLPILQAHDQPDHEDLNSRKQSKNKQELICNQDNANKDESFIGGILQVRSTGGLADTRAYGEE